MTMYVEDLFVGQRIRLGRHTVSEQEILDFARQWDPVLIHTDPAAAQHAPTGGLIASGLHTLGIYQRLAVRALWSDFDGGIGRGLRIRFRHPVRPGTTLSGQITVVEISERPDRGDAVVLLDAELSDQDGQVVLTVGVDAALPSRAASSPG